VGVGGGRPRPQPPTPNPQSPIPNPQLLNKVKLNKFGNFNNT